MADEKATVRELFRRLYRAQSHPFPVSGRALLCPPRQGVYLIMDRKGRVSHVGRTTRAQRGLLDRLRAHLRGRSSFVRLFLKGRRDLLRRGYTYSWIEVRSPRLRALLEAYTTGFLCPRHIGTGSDAAS